MKLNWTGEINLTSENSLFVKAWTKPQRVLEKRKMCMLLTKHSQFSELILISLIIICKIYKTWQFLHFSNFSIFKPSSKIHKLNLPTKSTPQVPFHLPPSMDLTNFTLEMMPSLFLPSLKHINNITGKIRSENFIIKLY